MTIAYLIFFYGTDTKQKLISIKEFNLNMCDALDAAFDREESEDLKIMRYCSYETNKFATIQQYCYKLVSSY